VIRSDNGSEFIGRAIREWLSAKQVGTLFIAPGSPWENGYAESFPVGCGTSYSTTNGSRRWARPA
jgi:transposase InsO family protein